MIIVLTPDDLCNSFKDNYAKPELKNFPAIISMMDDFGLNTVIIYKYKHETFILKGPLNEKNIFIREYKNRNTRKKLIN